jgi:hypothetical protein
VIILFDTINQYLSENPDTLIKEIRLTNIDMPTTTYLCREFNKRFPEDKHGKTLELRRDQSPKERPSKLDKADPAETETLVDETIDEDTN